MSSGRPNVRRVTGATASWGKRQARRLVRWLTSDYFRYVVFPLLVFFLAYTLANWQQIYYPYDLGGDSAVNALQVERAKGFREYLGPYSRYGFHHPGPMVFYYAALAESLLFFLPYGQALLSQVLLQLLFLLLCLHIVYHSFKPAWHPLLLAAAALFSLYPFLGSWFFISDWAPAQIILPMAAFILSAANLAHGRVRYLLPLTLAGLFVGQTHIGGAVVVLPLALLALALYGVGQLRRRTRLDRTDRACLVAAAVLFAVALLPPVYEQLTAPYGNMSRLYDFYVRGEIPGHYVAGQEATHTLAESWALILSFYADPPIRITGSGVPYLFPALLLAAGLLQLRRRKELTNELFLFLLAGLALSVWSASQVQGTLLKYLLWFEYGLVALWVFLLLRGLDRGLRFLWQKAGRPLSRVRLPAFLYYIAILAVTVPAVLLAYPLVMDRSYNVHAFTEAVAPQAGRTYLLWWNRGNRNQDQWVLAAGLVYHWTRAGYRVCVADPWWEFMFGPELICPAAPDEAYPVLLSTSSAGTTASLETIFTHGTTTLEAGAPAMPWTLQATAGETFFWGWSGAEGGRRWAEIQDPRVYFFLPGSISDSLALDLSYTGSGEGTVRLLLNGNSIGEMAMAGGRPVAYQALLPASFLRPNTINELLLVLPQPPGQPGAAPTRFAFRALTLQAPRQGAGARQ